MFETGFNKYKNIIISVVVFILLDLSVLAFNFYISYQISQDAVEINLAGQQRTLTQRITKSLLEFERAYHKSRPYEFIINDIEKSLLLFDNTLSAFDVGGDVIVGDRIVSIEPLADDMGREAIEKSKPMWAIFKNYTADVISEFKGRENIEEDLVTIFFRESIVKDVVVYTTSNDLELLGVMESLTLAVERVAFAKTRKLRFAQAIAISLAVINFFFILFFSLKKLKKSDDELNFAKTEIDVMLHNITEGMFLLDSDFRISEQYSKQMEIIFNDVRFGGKSLLKILGKIAYDFNEEGVKNFLKAFFDKNKNVSVLNALNPLKEILVKVRNDGDSGFEDKHLSFSFARIEKLGVVDRLLVRVVDATDDVFQERMLHEEKSRQFKHLRLISALMNTNIDVLPSFFDKTFLTINKTKALLEDYKENNVSHFSVINSLLVEMRQEAELLGFDVFVDLIGELAREVEKTEKSVEFSDLVYVQVIGALNNLIEHADLMHEFSKKVLSKKSEKVKSNGKNTSLSVASWVHLKEFVNDIALREHKEVDLSLVGLSDFSLPENIVALLNSIIFQILYHSVLLGIEDPDQRRLVHKSKSGLLDVRLVKKKNGGFYLTIRNDGVGLDVQALYEMVAHSDDLKVISPHEITKKQLCRLLLNSYAPSGDELTSYRNELLFGGELVNAIATNAIKFDVRSVTGEGAVFEFVFPAMIIEEVF